MLTLVNHPNLHLQQSLTMVSSSSANGLDIGQTSDEARSSFGFGGLGLNQDPSSRLSSRASPAPHGSSTFPPANGFGFSAPDSGTFMSVPRTNNPDEHSSISFINPFSYHGNTSVSSSPGFYDSPASQNYYYPPPQSLSHSSSYSHSNSLGHTNWLGIDFNGSYSPQSSSSTPQIWQQPNRYKRFRSECSPADSDTSGCTPLDQAAYPVDTTLVSASQSFPEMIPFAQQDTYDEQTLTRELASIPNLPRDLTGQACFGALDQKYLTAFWHNFNPMFSIIHRPTFDAVGTSPLVKALMIAIGSQHFDDELSHNISRTMRETSLKLLQRVSALPTRLNTR